jgi:hypothetical protein
MKKTPAPKPITALSKCGRSRVIVSLAMATLDRSTYAITYEMKQSGISRQ